MENKVRKRWVGVLSALGSEPRLQIVEMLTKGQVECQEILGRLTLSQPAVSYHLGKLERTGVLIKNKTGTRQCYRLSPHIRHLIKIMTKEDEQ